jgi:polyhydroxybutyrate depolymerase
MRPAAGLERRTVDVGGARRGFLLCRPAAEPTGIVLSLHGRGTTARFQVSFTGMDRLATSRDAVVVFPQGSIRIDRQGAMWDPQVDVDYLTRVVDEVRTEFAGVDPRVCIAGMSNGAFMACAFAAARAEDVAVLAAVAGLRAPAEPPARPVPVVAFHGLLDRALPYQGGTGSRLNERVVHRQNVRGGHSAAWPGAVRRQAVPDAALAWARANGVESVAGETAVSPTLRRTTYGEGTQGEVTLWTFADAGHTWPGQPMAPPLRLLFGHTSHELDATEEIWRFFQHHRSEGV